MAQCNTMGSFIIFLVAGIIARGALADEPETIVSGVTADEGEFPYVVSLRYDGAFICGGSIISDKHILTAAHCVENRMALRMLVRTGTIWREWYGQYHQVSHIAIHPKYNVQDVKGIGYDIAVLTLKDRITMDNMHASIPIASSDTPGNVKAQLIGWGQTSVDSSSSAVQRKAYLHTISTGDCQSTIGRYITDRQLCTREPEGTGACMGDSGSPLVYNNEVVGIASWVYPCATGLPDVFTRVYSFRWFIQDAMTKHP